MAYLRRLPSGRWQATVRLPNGRKTTRTDPLKRIVERWAATVEVDIDRGRWRDPRSGRRLTVGQWRHEWAA